MVSWSRVVYDDVNLYKGLSHGLEHSAYNILDIGSTLFQLYVGYVASTQDWLGKVYGKIIEGALLH